MTISGGTGGSTGGVITLTGGSSYGGSVEHKRKTSCINTLLDILYN